MPSVPARTRTMVALALLTALAGCRDSRPSPNNVEFDRDELLSADQDRPETMARTMECLKKDAEGNCLQNQCKESPEGEIADCGSFGKACVDAGLHWKGSKQGGVCSVPGHQ